MTFSHNYGVKTRVHGSIMAEKPLYYTEQFGLAVTALCTQTKLLQVELSSY